MRKGSLVRQVALASAAALTLAVAAEYTRPVFVGRTKVAQRVLSPTYVDSTEIRAPWIRSAPELAVLGQQFLRDRNAFTVDLMRTGKLTEDRASRIADAAVRQAYHERVPPALVLGVMLTENGEFKPKSQSNVGAVGLMQIMGRHWIPALRKKFGDNLRDDATNVRYGVFILGHMARNVPDSLDEQSSWRKALLRYNGCVSGTNTKHCHRYPDVVRRHVERSAHSTCGGKPFDQCVVSPLVRSMRTSKPKLPPMFAHLAQKPVVPGPSTTTTTADGEVEQKSTKKAKRSTRKARSGRSVKSRRATTSRVAARTSTRRGAKSVKSSRTSRSRVAARATSSRSARRNSGD